MQLNDLRTNLSNVTPEEFAARLRQQQKQAKCPACGARRERTMQMSRYTDDMAEFLRRNNGELEQDSCILCVEKHLADAQNAIRKMNDSTGIPAERYRLDGIGNLREATDESTGYSELHDALAVAERDFRYNGNAPDYDAIAALILKVKREIEK